MKNVVAVMVFDSERSIHQVRRFHDPLQKVLHGLQDYLGPLEHHEVIVIENLELALRY